MQKRFLPPVAIVGIGGIFPDALNVEEFWQNVKAGRSAARVAVTMVHLKRLHADEIERYLDSGEWHGKAGGYAIQGLAEIFVKQINGSYSNIVGLPLQVTLDLLRGLGWRSSG